MNSCSRAAFFNAAILSCLCLLPSQGWTEESGGKGLLMSTPQIELIVDLAEEDGQKWGLSRTSISSHIKGRVVSFP
jgi:hypothetical protein